ncbi:MAG: cell division FtsZ family protein [Deltaproteobacteria bacterium]|jgi:cell division protein FtsZ|nr:cell division FtsZ family protein [Deltaproteobacteria bacterium]
MNTREKHVFKVFGLGGCGNNVISHMIDQGLEGPVFVAANANARFLKGCKAPNKIQVGVNVTRGGGCGGDPKTGRKCVEEKIPDILATLAGSDLVFLTGGLGGGLGSGGLPVVAKALSELKNAPLIVAVVTRPFSYEDYRLPLAEQATAELYKYCNAVISVDNSKLESLDPETPYLENMRKGDDVLFRAVSSIINLVETPGEINVDFADVSTVLSHKGPAIISFGEATGDRRAVDALDDALANPMLAETSLKGAQAVICVISADSHVLVREVMDINERIHKSIGSCVKLFFGLVIDDSLKESRALRVSLLATGLGGKASAEENIARSDSKLVAEPVKVAANMASVNKSVGNKPAGNKTAENKTAGNKVVRFKAVELKSAERNPVTPAQPKPSLKPVLNMEVTTITSRPHLTLETSSSNPMEPTKSEKPLAVAPGPYATPTRRVIRPSLGVDQRANRLNESSATANDGNGRLEQLDYVIEPAN